jgi:hypothetical protein
VITRQKHIVSIEKIFSLGKLQTPGTSGNEIGDQFSIIINFDMFLPLNCFNM